MIRFRSMDKDQDTRIGKLLKQQRTSLDLTLQQVAGKAAMSSSHLGRIERGERYPSGTMLRKLAKPLDFTDEELMHLAGYLTAGPKEEPLPFSEGRLDPFVARLLAAEPIERQRQVIAILLMMKSVAKDAAETMNQQLSNSGV